MTVSGIWQNIGAGANVLTKVLRLAFLLAGAVLFYFFAVLPFAWPQQTLCGLLILLMAMAIARNSDSHLVTLTLIGMSMFCTFRYGYWRIARTAEYFHDPANHWGAIDAFFILSLLGAELYAFLILFLGYFQTIWPLRRAPVALPDEVDEWPHVDVLIPTYNEPLDVVRYTVLGALNMDWPADRLHIYILDDGRREEFEQFAFEAGVGYKARPDNQHAKAGNINAALPSIDSPYVAIFDSDHVPTRSFLQVTMGWFRRDPKLAMLQTPHHFYSPDPFERNLGQFRIIPNEGELFYGVVQDGNDFWNATYFCGSCAVLRRDALDAVGGIAVDTVTEDAHTSLRMQMKGWGTAYINIPQAAGLATERLSAHVAQRIRWARGMIQILRTENPLFARGLTFPQRLCYFNAMCHFLYAVPRLIFLTAPLIYLIFSHTNVPGYWAAILAYALPHLALSSMTNSRIQGAHRYSFWNEIYETVLAPYILLPTMMALINPRLGRFNVTAKGGVVKRTFFDTRIAQPFLILLLFNIAGLVIAFPRFFIWDRDRPGTVLMNVLWCCFNIVILGVASAAAREMKQLRTAVRIDLVTPVMTRLANGTLIGGETFDMSSGGCGIQLAEHAHVDAQTQLRLTFPLPSIDTELPATVVSSDGGLLRVQFNPMTIDEQEVLTMVLYSRADSWLGWGESRESDDVLRSMGRIIRISMHGLLTTFKSLVTARNSKAGKKTALSVARPAAILILGGMLSAAGHSAHAAHRPNARSQASKPDPPAAAQGLPAGSPLRAPGQFHESFTLADTGSAQVELRGVDSSHSIYFALPQTHAVRSAKVHIYYSFSSSLLPRMSQIKLLMNGTPFATVQPTPGPAGGSSSQDQDAEFPIPANLLQHRNAFTMEFTGHSTTACEDPANAALWARVHRSTYFDIEGNLLPVADNLKQLPLPFLDPAVIEPLSIPIAFPTPPSARAIQAAGVVASYFGTIAEGRPVRFPVYIGQIPAGNAILLSENSAGLPSGMSVSDTEAPSVAMRTNPGDPYGKILLVTGSDSNQLLTAARAVAIHSDQLHGAEATIDHLALPEKQSADMAPRWARTGQLIPLVDFASAGQLQGDGSTPLNIYFHIPPDVFYAAGQPNAILKLAYRYNPAPIGPTSNLQVQLNNAAVGSVPLEPAQETARDVQVDMPVPVVNLRPFSNSIAFDFSFQVIRNGGCQGAPPANTQGSILKDTSLDLRGYRHYTTLPNLELFANAGFPFTRYADMSETTVVLPPAPTVPEIETFVTMMGHFGRQTGFPALRVTVAGPEALHSGAEGDFLVIGTGDDQPAFYTLAEHLPVALRGGQMQVQDTLGIFAPQLHNAWWKPRDDVRTESGDLMAGGMPDAVIEAIQSPFDSRGSSSVVGIHLRNANSFEPFISTFLSVQQSSDISGNVSVLHGSQFQSFRIGAEAYHVGSLPMWTRLTLWFTEFPWLAAIVVFLQSFLFAVWAGQWLRAKAKERLKVAEA
jgi:cellulose synthase (UDP-forming)